MKKFLGLIIISSLVSIVWIMVVGKYFPTITFGTSLTTLNSTDLQSNFPTTYNANNTALNSGKVEASDLYASTTMPQLTTLANLITIGNTTSSSTFASGLSAKYLNLTGTSATSTFANGVNVTGGCILFNGSCLGQSAGGVTSITASTPNSTLSVGGTNPVTTSGTISFDLNLGHANAWTILQQFQNASTTLLDCLVRCSFGSTATTTITSTGKIGYASTTPSEAISVVGGSIFSTENAQATTSSITVNMLSQNQSLLQIGTVGTTVTLANIIPGQAKRIVICNPGSTASTITWATSPVSLLLWSGGTAPIQTTTANKCDVYTFTVTQGTSTAATSPIIFGGFIQNF